METKICVVGLGYVGLPLALELSKHFDVTGFEINEKKVKSLLEGIDPSNEIKKENLDNSSIIITCDKEKIKGCNFIIICVPTPIDDAKKTDLTCLKSVSEMVGKYLSQESIVVYESTVYPGVTEEICVPILEKASKMKYGIDFKVGYSPERINPGDKTHTIDKIIKIVSGSDEKSLEKISSVYKAITKIHQAPSIKVAEAAKVIENIQRDLNIALMNELSIIFDKLKINTNSVINAAGTKWNFHKYHPGLVGGHCIGVDPYYLTYKAEQIGYNPEVILAGRRINDNMHKIYAKKIIKKLIEMDIKIKRAKVLILGLTFKPNVSDYRNSRVKNLILELKDYGVNVYGHDPLLKDKIILEEFGVTNCDNVNLRVLAVEHDCLNVGSDVFRFD